MSHDNHCPESSGSPTCERNHEGSPQGARMGVTGVSEASREAEREGGSVLGPGAVPGRREEESGVLVS